MLKKVRVLFLGLVVLAGSACVTPTHASSAQGVVITYIQAGGGTGAKEELVVVYNNSSLEVDVTGWCLTNKYNVALVCLSEKTQNQSKTYQLPAYGYITFASQEYASAHHYSAEYYSQLYSVTNQSSGSIIGSADTVSLVDADGQVVNAKTWFASVPSGKAWARLKLMTNPDTYAQNNDINDWQVEAVSEPPISMLKQQAIPMDEEDPEPEDGGDGGGEGEGESGEDDSPALLDLIITELFINPSGGDAGKEYVEIFNPNTLTSVPLDGILLRVGFDNPYWYDLSGVGSIAGQSYLVISNQEVNFTLTNTAGRVQLFKGGIPLGAPIEYTNAKDDQAWALIDTVWQYTNQPTPGLENWVSTSEVNEVDEAAAGASKECASNQYRNPTTGRCRLIVTATTSVAVCKEGQERNPETNRCRNIVQPTTPAPCKENQERNPETNRCRTVAKMSNANYKTHRVEAGVNNQPAWYYWAAIIVIVSLVVVYAVWEWREELKVLGKRVKGFVTR